MSRVFRITRERLKAAFSNSRNHQPTEEFRFEVFDCGISQGRYRTEFEANRRAVKCWGGYVIDRETGERCQ